MATCENTGIMMLNWPAQLSDINLIENIWAKMKMIVCYHSLPLSSITVLTNYVKNVQDNISPEYYKKLIDSMPRRVEAIIATNGNRINY